MWLLSQPLDTRCMFYVPHTNSLAHNKSNHEQAQLGGGADGGILIVIVSLSLLLLLLLFATLTAALANKPRASRVRAERNAPKYALI